jgi:hypothetical protein
MDVMKQKLIPIQGRKLQQLFWWYLTVMMCSSEERFSEINPEV